MVRNGFAGKSLWHGTPVHSPLRACLKIRRGAVFAGRAGWRGATRENTLHGSTTEEQRNQTARPSKTLRAAGLLPLAFFVTSLTARYGDARPAPPRPKPKSLAAAPLPIFRQALREVLNAEAPARDKSFRIQLKDRDGARRIAARETRAQAIDRLSRRYDVLRVINLIGRITVVGFEDDGCAGVGY